MTKEEKGKQHRKNGSTERNKTGMKGRRERLEE